MRISDWSSDVCSSDLTEIRAPISGRIDRHRISIGNLVEPNATILTSIVSLDPIYFYFDIDERSFLAYARDARERGVSLQEGAGAFKVKVRLSDERDGSFEGTLDFAENRVDEDTDRKSTRLNSSHYCATRMPSS